MGLERLVLLVQAVNPEFKADSVVDIYLVASGADTQSMAMQFAERARCASGRQTDDQPWWRQL